MNIYRHIFTAKCPSQPAASILYHLEIQTDQVIMVEVIVAACEEIREGFHETIADKLHQQFGGCQTMTAHHHGVDIETRRGCE